MVVLCTLYVPVVGDPDPQFCMILGLLDPDPDPLVRGTDPDPDPYLFLINVLSGLIMPTK